MNDPQGEPKIVIELSVAIDLVALLETCELLLQIMPPLVALGTRNRLSDDLHRVHGAVYAAILAQLLSPSSVPGGLDVSMIARGRSTPMIELFLFGLLCGLIAWDYFERG